MAEYDIWYFHSWRQAAGEMQIMILTINMGEYMSCYELLLTWICRTGTRTKSSQLRIINIKSSDEIHTGTNSKRRGHLKIRNSTEQCLIFQSAAICCSWSRFRMHNVQINLLFSFIYIPKCPRKPEAELHLYWKTVKVGWCSISQHPGHFWWCV